MTKTLVLVRHAHRDTSDSGADNGLSPKGRQQAEAIRRFYQERFGGGEALLLSSPKRRCRETLGPLAKALAQEVLTDIRLLEGPEGMEEGISAFLKWWKEKAPARVVACSHGDWIPAFLGLAAGEETGLEKGAWAELSLEKGGPRLAHLKQRLL